MGVLAKYLATPKRLTGLGVVAALSLLFLLILVGLSGSSSIVGLSGSSSINDDQSEYTSFEEKVRQWDASHPEEIARIQKSNLALLDATRAKERGELEQWKASHPEYAAKAQEFFDAVDLYLAKKAETENQQRHPVPKADVDSHQGFLVSQIGDTSGREVYMATSPLAWVVLDTALLRGESWKGTYRDLNQARQAYTLSPGTNVLLLDHSCAKGYPGTSEFQPLPSSQCSDSLLRTHHAARVLVQEGWMKGAEVWLDERNLRRGVNN